MGSLDARSEGAAVCRASTAGAVGQAYGQAKEQVGVLPIRPHLNYFIYWRRGRYEAN